MQNQLYKRLLDKRFKQKYENFNFLYNTQKKS